VCREVRTSRAAALAVATIVTAGVVVGFALHSHHHSSVTLPAVTRSSATQPASAPPRGPVLAGLATSAARPTAAGVASELAASAKTVANGAHLVGEVIDADTGALLWSRDPTQGEPPASTTKLLTAAAVLTALGPSARLATTTRRDGNTVYLVGGGDPTIVATASSYVSPSYPQPATLAALARQTAKALGTTRRIHLRLDTSAWSGPTAAKGWKPSYVTEGDVTPPSALELNEGRVDPEDEFASRTPTPAAQAGDEFADLLTQDGIKVVGPTRIATAPATSAALTSVSSPPMAALVQRMLTVSDDDLAEALGRAVAIHDKLPATFVGAGEAVTRTVASLGVPTTGVLLQDTSGLSHLDRVTPAALVAVLRDATSPAHPALRAIVEGLPIAGLTGTLAARFTTKPTSVAAGLLRAKTGTLSGVNTLAGTVVDRSGRLLIFSFLASDAELPGLTVPEIDVLASRLVHCGCSG
jgi:D-alanyl-D-alanine carboxypeptidase/D-alanyl-D-alanine-endopeptidase (penicillin-binding protein 4)